MAKISHRGSCRSKSSTEFKCICFEKGNRWDGECWSRQCKTHEIRQCLYRSGNKTTMQKSPEDNQATGLFTCESFTTQNPKFIKIWTGWTKKSKKNFNHKESLLSKGYPYDTVCTFNHQRTNYSKKRSILDTIKRNTTVHSQPWKMFSMPEI